MVYDRVLGRVIDKEEHLYLESKRHKNSRSSLPSPQVMKDIEPFRNVAVDGKMITSRSQKREMMRQHGLIEVGNERNLTKPKPKPSRRQVRDSLKRTIQQLGV